MKRLLLIFIALWSIPLAVFAQKDIFLSPKFNELTKEHKVLAIIPFKSVLDLNTTQKADSEEIEGKAVQTGLENYFNQRKKRKKFTVEFQEIKTTNQILNDQKINYDDIGLYSSKDLARILGVDGIISGSIQLNVLLSQGIEKDSGLGDFLFFDSDFGRIAVKISDGMTGKLLWKYDKAITRKGGKNTIEFIDSMMKKASRNFPYDRN
ncbi:MAG: hypothetical protein ACPGAO_02610 [Flavobacteriaceae bacterium]